MNTPYFLKIIAENIFSISGAEAFPDSYYIGLSVSEPNKEGICNGEPFASDSGYERVKLSSIASHSDGSIYNTSNISFRESTASWGNIKYYVVYDASVGGNLLFWNKLAKSITVDSGHVVTIKTGDLTIRVTDPT